MRIFENFPSALLNLCLESQINLNEATMMNFQQATRKEFSCSSSRRQKIANFREDFRFIQLNPTRNSTSNKSQNVKDGKLKSFNVLRLACEVFFFIFMIFVCANTFYCRIFFTFHSSSILSASKMLPFTPPRLCIKVSSHLAHVQAIFRIFHVLISLRTFFFLLKENRFIE